MSTLGVWVLNSSSAATRPGNYGEELASCWHDRAEPKHIFYFVLAHKWGALHFFPCFYSGYW